MGVEGDFGSVGGSSVVGGDVGGEVEFVSSWFAIQLAFALSQ